MKTSSKAHSNLEIFLKKKAIWVRQEAFNMAIRADRGHLGGAFSVTDILVSIYYSKIFRLSKKQHNSPNRDRLIFSKGHACLSLYPILADLGFFDKNELIRYGHNGTFLGGHPDHFIPGGEVSSGSLGHGLSIGAGIALSAKLDKKKFNTLVILGDGECMEGSTWEAASFASVQNLNNLIVIIDNNGVGATDFVKNFMGGKSLSEKFKSFGWEVFDANGHNFNDLLSVFIKIKDGKFNFPVALIAKTIKGKGVSFMENKYHWHHGIPKGKLLDQALEELGLKKNNA